MVSVVHQDASDSQDSLAPASQLRKRSHAGISHAFAIPFSGPAHASSSLYGASSGVAHASSSLYGGSSGMAQRDAAADVLQVCDPWSRNSFLYRPTQ